MATDSRGNGGGGGGGASGVRSSFTCISCFDDFFTYFMRFRGSPEELEQRHKSRQIDKSLKREDRARRRQVCTTQCSGVYYILYGLKCVSNTRRVCVRAYVFSACLQMCENIYAYTTTLDLCVERTS